MPTSITPLSHKSRFKRRRDLNTKAKRLGRKLKMNQSMAMFFLNPAKPDRVEICNIFFHLFTWDELVPHMPYTTARSVYLRCWIVALVPFPPSGQGGYRSAGRDTRSIHSNGSLCTDLQTLKTPKGGEDGCRDGSCLFSPVLQRAAPLKGQAWGPALHFIC